MIQPTVGRTVWFYQYIVGAGHKGPLAAKVARVLSDSLVNLCVFDQDGNAHARLDVVLVQDDAQPPPSHYCTWMPYQKEKAAEAEVAKKKVKK